MRKFPKEHCCDRYPWTMVVEIQSTDATRRAVMCSRRSPGAGTSIFVTHCELPLLVHAFVCNVDGTPTRDIVAGNIVCRPAQTQPNVQDEDGE